MEGKGGEGGHGRYLSLGDEGGGIEEEEGVGEGEREGRVKGPRDRGVCTPKREMGGKRGSVIGKGMGTPGSLYDGAGFLRDRESGGGGVAV